MCLCTHLGRGREMLSSEGVIAIKLEGRHANLSGIKTNCAPLFRVRNQNLIFLPRIHEKCCKASWEAAVGGY